MEYPLSLYGSTGRMAGASAFYARVCGIFAYLFIYTAVIFVKITIISVVCSGFSMCYLYKFTFFFDFLCKYLLTNIHVRCIVATVRRNSSENVRLYPGFRYKTIHDLKGSK